MTSDTLKYEIGTIGRDLGTIARKLVRIANHVTITGRGVPETPPMPEVVNPLADGDTYQRLLTALLGLVGRDVAIIWTITHHPSAFARGTLGVIDDPEHPTAIGCKLGNCVGFWFHRNEVFDVEAFDCGCVAVCSVGGQLVIGSVDCAFDNDRDGQSPA
jgi:hypothetical protein